MQAIAQTKLDALNAQCAQMRIDLIRLLHKLQTGHPGGSLSACEILSALYFEMAKVDQANPKWPERDRIILTKGHAAPMLYMILAKRGFFPEADMDTLRQLGSHLQGHPCAKTTPGVELSTGPLGIGVSAAVGMAMALRLDKNPATVYAVMGDGEINEGTVWEACMSASKFKLDNLVAIVDLNGVQLDGRCEEIMPMDDVPAKFGAFGFEVFRCDGHDIADLCKTIGQAKAVSGKPSVILARTVKGKGVSFMEGQSAWHGAPIGRPEFEQAMKDLGGEPDV